MASTTVSMISCFDSVATFAVILAISVSYSDAGALLDIVASRFDTSAFDAVLLAASVVTSWVVGSKSFNASSVVFVPDIENPVLSVIALVPTDQISAAAWVLNPVAVVQLPWFV